MDEASERAAGPTVTPRAVSRGGRFDWSDLPDRVSIAGRQIPSAIGPVPDDPAAGSRQRAGVRRSSRRSKLLKRIVWPLARRANVLIGDGIAGLVIGRLVRRTITQPATLLDVGCGGMELIDRLPPGVVYNGVDIAFSEFRAEHVLRRHPDANIAFASAYELPVADAQVTVLACNQMLHQVPEPERVLDEFHRVLVPGGHLVLGVSNEYATKYAKKGPHPDSVNAWTLAELTGFVSGHGFECLESSMRGWWVPLPPRLMRRSLHLPIAARAEADNSFFFFVFRRVRDDAVGGSPGG